jgi:hypothetical protein
MDFYENERPKNSEYWRNYVFTSPGRTAEAKSRQRQHTLMDMPENKGPELSEYWLNAFLRFHTSLLSLLPSPAPLARVIARTP